MAEVPIGVAEKEESHSTPFNLNESCNQVSIMNIEESPQNSLINKGSGEGEGGRGVDDQAMRPTLVGDEGISIGDSLVTTPRIWRRKGTWELSESSMQPR